MGNRESFKPERNRPEHAARSRIVVPLRSYDSPFPIPARETQKTRQPETRGGIPESLVIDGLKRADTAIHSWIASRLLSGSLLAAGVVMKRKR
jgi:hypothetical protein